MPKKRSAENEIVGPAASAAMPLRRKSASRTRVKRSAEAETPVANITGTVAEVVETAADPLSAPGYHEIAQLAYSFWVARGCQGGSPEEDWRRAEEQLRARTAAVNA
jgi:hypothetical protein